MKGCAPLSPIEYRLTLRHLRGRYKWRDRALFILGNRTGMRISELLSLKVDQVWAGSVRPRVYLHRQDTKCQLAGSSIIIHPKAAEALAKWIEVRGPVSPTDWLFPSQRCPGKPLRRQAAWLLLHKAFVAAGVSGVLGTHIMRKNFCLSVYKSLNGDVWKLARAMRHTSPLTTMAYISFRQEEIDRAILRA